MVKKIFMFCWLLVVESLVNSWGGAYNFQEPVSIPTGKSPRGLVVGHFGPNPLPCLAVADFGSPTFIGQSTPQTLLLGQIGKVQVFSSSANGLSLLSEIPVGWSPRGLAAIPDGLGQDDLLVSCYDQSILQMFRWDGVMFRKLDERSVLSQPVGVSYGTTKAGGIHFAVVAEYGANQISVMEISNGKFGIRHDYLVPAGPTQVSVGDINGDGRNEIVVACLGTGQLVILSPSSTIPNDLSAYTITESLSPAPGADISDFRIADLNHDGRMDLVATDFTKNNVWVYLQQKDGSLVLQPTLNTSGSHPNGLTVARMDAAELPVIVVANRDSDLLDLFQWNGSLFQLIQTLKVSSDVNTSFGPVEVAAMDSKGIGDVDLVTTHMRTNSIKVLNQILSPTLIPTPLAESPVDSRFTSQRTFFFPNPSRDGHLTLSFNLPYSQTVSLKVFDISGNLVYDQLIGSGQTQAGLNQIQWNGVNEKGARLASGLYIYKVTVGNQTVTKKFAIIR
jgi:hypothetical protein